MSIILIRFEKWEFWKWNLNFDWKFRSFWLDNWVFKGLYGLFSYYENIKK